MSQELFFYYDVSNDQMFLFEKRYTRVVSFRELPKKLKGDCAVDLSYLRLKVGTKVKGLLIGDPRILRDEVEYLGSSCGGRGTKLPVDIAEAARENFDRWLIFRFTDGSDDMLYILDYNVALAPDAEITLP